MKYKEKLERLIPGGAHTYSRGSDQYPSNAPSLVAKGNGAYLYDLKGKKYLDYGMGLRSVTIGYNNREINDGAISEIKKGNNLTKPSIAELKAAQEFTKLIPGADMVKFAKHGSNVTTAAVKLARSYTGKEIVCFPKEQPFFSFDDWFIGSTKITKGVLKKTSNFSKTFTYNDLSSLKKIFKKFPKNIACVILEPATFLTPCFNSCKIYSHKFKCKNCNLRKENFLSKVRSLCNKYSSLLIFDEMISGFRWDLKGAQNFFNVTPDLSTFGKAMANGFSLSALAGKRKIMEYGSINKKNRERTFLLSSTHGAEMSSLGAFLATIKFYKKNKVINHLWNFGEKLKNEINNLSKELDLDKYFFIEGPSICLNYRTKNKNYEDCLILRTLFQQEMVKNGILMPWIAPSYSHKNKEFDLTIKACKLSLLVYKKALIYGTKKYLKGPSIKPVFRRYN